MNSQKTGVLFVCLGNICRSPMAEAVFRHLVEKKGIQDKFRIDSAGTGDWHVGHRPHRGTQEVLQSHGVSSAGMFARQVKASDFDEFEYIICMDDSNVTNVKGFAKGNYQSTVNRLLEWSTKAKLKQPDANVPDPYYDGRFEYVFQLVEQACTDLLKTLEARIVERNQ